MTRYIIISGIDGSGKTAIINALKERLEQEGLEVKYIWMRYNHYLVKFMNALARLFRLSVKVHNAMGTVWEHRLYKWRWFCKVYVCCSYLDNLMARHKVMALKADYIICDRWVHDVLVDLGAECRFGDILESRWYRRFQAILPENSHQFVVSRKKTALLDCRLENNINPDFEYRFELYQKLMQTGDVCVVDNNGTISESVGQILLRLGNELPKG